MTIHFWLPHIKLSGGVRVILTYADLLAQRGHSVSIVIPVKAALPRVLGNVLRRRPQWFPNLSAKIVRVSSWHDAPRAEVIIADSWRAAEALSKIESKKKIHFIQHDERLYHGDTQLVSRVYAQPLQKVTVSSWLQDMLRTDFKQNATLLLNSVDRTLFHPSSTPRQSNECRVLLLDHEYAWKGTEEGVLLVERLKKTHPHVKLVMFGTRRSSTPFPCDEYHYNLPQTGLSDLYSSCDVYLCPSWDEGFGLPSLEAMACGVALVTYDNGGSRDYAIEGDTTFVAPRKDQEVLFQKLLLSVEQKEIRQAVARRGYERVLSMPTWNEQVSKLESLCTQ